MDESGPGRVCGDLDADGVAKAIAVYVRTIVSGARAAETNARLRALEEAANRSGDVHLARDRRPL